MGRHRDFWNKEYKTGEHLALSRTPSEDLEKFTRFLEREYKHEYLNPLAQVVDLGCGNGRNLIYLSETFGMPGVGYDISDVAIREATHFSEGLPITYEVRSIEGTFPQKDESVTLILDMMSSHFLKQAEREALRDEIVRMLRPGAWLFFKSFLLEDDINAKMLLRDHPAGEEKAYIHPKLGVYEYVWTEDAVRDFFDPYFEIHRLYKSHKHLRRGRAGKRRTLSAYLQKRI